MSQKTITINGQLYDAYTGMPIQNVHTEEQVAATMPLPSASQHSASIHQTTQKSQTLNRQVVKRIASVQPPSTSQQPSARKSPMVSKFAPHAPDTKRARVISDIGPMKHPMTTRTEQRLQASSSSQVESTTQAPKPAQIIKQEAIAEALRKAPSRADASKQPRPKKSPRMLSIASASLALLLLGGYFTYLNMPNLSVRVAAAQAGVNASYPEYRPDGYSLKGPVAYNHGEVVMKFAANGGGHNFTVTQSKSGWDSSAVFANYVKEKAGENYITYNERGLTIYTFDGNAAWVNRGVLYTINGDAPLSGDQIRRIATSM